MPTAEEEKLRQDIRDVYNSGDCKKAVELACVFLEQFPKSHFARYEYAVMHGDYACSPEHTVEKKKELLEIAKQGVSELFHDPSFHEWSPRFQQSVRNEFYWFFELPEEQYKLGIERLQAGENGHYSACVGASMMAHKKLKESDISAAEDWAHKALNHFAEFEKLVPDWYNINYFAAQALACLGRYADALVCFKGMYHKQKSFEKTDEIAEFNRNLEEIKNLRK